ncbi:DUF2971 domain-containing protein [Propionispira raffinosivorans]|uniref:DUF2971 domain-containing protein n=1 Tax=Propionispira raffinosivorans TaxID=86959 RepID=UPI00037A08F9|nr:DUF2971 domain-containing protein [Propionispira raffinosivorans]
MDQSLIYRYRPMKSILGDYKELEKQEIFFASMEELNDPMEGSITPFYKGVKEHWIGVFRFYFREVCNDYLTKNYPGRFSDPKDLLDIENLFIQSELIQKIVEEMGKSEVYYTNAGIVFCFQYLLHPYIYWFIAFNVDKYLGAATDQIESMNAIYHSAKKLVEDIIDNKITGIHNFIRPQDALQNVEAVYIIQKYIQENWKLFCFEKTIAESFTGAIYNASWMIFRKFDESARPQFRIASFSKRNDNTSLWGHYANAQKGICLCYNLISDGKKKSIHFKGNSFENLYFEKVDYREKLYQGDNAFNILSIFENRLCGSPIDPELMKSPYLQKTVDWQYEEEYRLLIPNMGKDYAKICYDFSALNSIIFGRNTSFSDRYSVIDIIRDKLKKNGQRCFNFYEFNIENDNWSKQPIYTIQ